MFAKTNVGAFAPGPYGPAEFNNSTSSNVAALGNSSVSIFTFGETSIGAHCCLMISLRRYIAFSKFSLATLSPTAILCPPPVSNNPSLTNF